MSNESDFQTKWRKLIEKSWSDPQFKQSLMDNPNKVLAENGLKTPGVNFTVVENQADRLYLILPASPTHQPGVGTAGAETLSQYHAACF